MKLSLELLFWRKLHRTVRFPLWTILPDHTSAGRASRVGRARILHDTRSRQISRRRAATTLLTRLTSSPEPAAAKSARLPTGFQRSRGVVTVGFHLQWDRCALWKEWGWENPKTWKGGLRQNLHLWGRYKAEESYQVNAGTWSIANAGLATCRFKLWEGFDSNITPAVVTGGGIIDWQWFPGSGRVSCREKSTMQARVYLTIKTLQELQMLSSVALNCQVTKISWIQVYNRRYCIQCLKGQKSLELPLSL